MARVMDESFDKIAMETIDLLEARLRRIEFALLGQTEVPSKVKETAAQRIASLEHSLHQLASKSQAVQELLSLHARYPDLFHSIKQDEIPTTLDTASILSIVLASASSYSSTASRLVSILDVPVPDASKSAQLIELVPRIAKVEAVQASQDAQISVLRERSAQIVKQWYTTDILRAGENWAEMEGRVEQVERQLRRAALAKQAEDAMV